MFKILENKPFSIKIRSWALSLILLISLTLGSTVAVGTNQLPIYSSLGGQFTLTDTQGQAVSLSRWQGKIIVLAFGFTACPYICPMTLQALTQMHQRLGKSADQVQIVFISIDPERDTPAKLADYLQAFNANIVGLTGSEQQLRQVAKAFGATFENLPEVAHTDRIYLLDADQRVRQIYAREGQFAALERDVRQLLPSSWWSRWW